MSDPLIKLLGSAARVKLMRLFLFNPKDAWSAAEAAKHAQVEQRVAQSELKLFAHTGLIKRASRRGVLRYMLASDFEYIEALQGLLLNAPARGRDIYERLRTAGNIRLIIIAGVFVGDWEGRLDLLIVGDRVVERNLRAKIRQLESELGKELRYALLTSADFLYRFNMSDKLVRDVLDYPHSVVHDRLQVGVK